MSLIVECGISELGDFEKTQKKDVALNSNTGAYKFVAHLSIESGPDCQVDIKASSSPKSFSQVDSFSNVVVKNGTNYEFQVLNNSVE